MKPFVKKEHFKPNAIEKMLKKNPSRNFVIDVNNLLAEKYLNELTPELVRELGEKYGLNDAPTKYKNELIQLLNAFLIEHLGNSGSDVNDFRSAQKLQYILGIIEKDFSEQYMPLASKIMKDQVFETLNRTKKCLAEEDAQFEKLRQILELPMENANYIIEEARKTIVQNYMGAMIADRRVSPEEILIFDKLCKDLVVSVGMDDTTRSTLEKFKRLWIIENGELQKIEPDIIMPKSEFCYLVCNVDLYENRKVTKRISYGGPTLRIKIMKGVYYRAGNLGVGSQSEDQMTLIDSGKLYVTNKKILFVGRLSNKNYKYNQIVDLDPYSDGVRIEKDSGKSPTFKSKDEDGEIITAMIARIISMS